MQAQPLPEQLASLESGVLKALVNHTLTLKDLWVDVFPDQPIGFTYAAVESLCQGGYVRRWSNLLVITTKGLNRVRYVCPVAA